MYSIDFFKLIHFTPLSFMHSNFHSDSINFIRNTVGICAFYSIRTTVRDIKYVMLNRWMLWSRRHWGWDEKPWRDIQGPFQAFSQLVLPGTETATTTRSLPEGIILSRGSASLAGSYMVLMQTEEMLHLPNTTLIGLLQFKSFILLYCYNIMCNVN